MSWNEFSNGSVPSSSHLQPANAYHQPAENGWQYHGNSQYAAHDVPSNYPIDSGYQQTWDNYSHPGWNPYAQNENSGNQRGQQNWVHFTQMESSDPRCEGQLQSHAEAGQAHQAQQHQTYSSFNHTQQHQHHHNAPSFIESCNLPLMNRQGPQAAPAPLHTEGNHRCIYFSHSDGRSSKPSNALKPHGKQLTPKLVRSEAAQGRIDSALEGMDQLLAAGQIDPVALELLTLGLIKAGRLGDATGMLERAASYSGGRGVLGLDKTNAVLAGMSMACAYEDAHARPFVEALVGLTDLAGPAAAAARSYYCRLAVGQVLEYLEEARVALERARAQPAAGLVRQGLCLMDVTCSPGRKPGEVVCG